MNLIPKNLFFLVTVIIGFCASGQNILKNGNFLKTVDDNKPAEWTFYPKTLPKGSSIVVDTTNSYTGGKSVRIHNSKAVYTRIDQTNVKVKPHTWYLVSYYIKGENVTNITGGGPRIFIGPNGGFKYALTTFGPGINPEKRKNWSFTWRKYSRKFNTGKNTKIGVTLYFHKSTGTVWFDDVQIVEITPNLDKNLNAIKVRKIISKEIDIVKDAAKKQKDSKIIEKLTTITQELKSWFPNNKPLRMKGLPFYPLQKDIYKLMGEVLAKKYPSQTVFISSSNPFARGKWLQADLKENADKIILSGLRGDIEQLALNLTNCSTKDRKVSFTLPDGLDTKVRQVIEVEVDNADLIDDALRLMNPGKDGKYSLEITAGMTKQLWFEIKLPNSPGSVNNKINFKFNGKEKNIDLKLVTLNKRFPAIMPLKTFVWGYPFIRKLTKGRISQCSADYKKHHVNTIYPHKWIVNSQSGIPLPIFDKKGNILTEKMEWSGFDKHLKHFPFCSTYIISADCFWRPHIFVKGIKLKKMSPQWKACLKAWIKELVKGFKKRGIGYDRFVLTWFDEPTPGKVNTLVQYVKIVREADPKVRIFNNFHNALAPNYVKKLAKNVDIIVPELHQITTETMEILKNSGKEIWMYRVQGKKTLPQNIRKSFWLLHQNNIKGASFWCYSDNHQEWFPKGQHSYSVIYGGDPSELTPSKRWEAWREGIEDYALLTMLKTSSPVAYNQIINKYDKADLNLLRKRILKHLSRTPL